MKRNLLKLLLLVVALVMGIGASAQTDLTATYLNNADFASANGWTAVTSNSFKDFGVGKIGSYQVRSEFPAATVDATHLNSESCAGFECRWSGNYASYTQTSKEALPAGTYALSYDVENTNEGTANANYESRFFVKVGDTTFKDESSEWMKGKSNWTKHYIVFKLSEASKFTVSLGWGTGDNNIGHMNTPALFVSHLKLSKLQNAEFPVDITSFVQNPEFRNLAQNAFPGWTTIHQQGDAKPIGSIGGEFWSWNKSAANFDFYQTVENLPNGKYTITANMWHSKDGEGDASVDGAVGVYGSSGNNNVFKGITTDTREDGRTDYTTDEIEVTNGTLRVGVKNNSAMHARWFGVDYIKLTLVSLTPPNASMIEAKYAEVDLAKKMNATTKQNLIDAYNAAKAAPSFDTYDALDAAVVAATTSIAEYATALSIINAASALDNDGKIVYAANNTVSAIQAAYNDGTLTNISTEQKAACEAALTAATKAQTTPGSDMTLLINNWDFLNCSSRNFPGWSIDAPSGNVQNFQSTSAEYWIGTAENGKFDYYQVIQGLNPGKYTIQAHMWNSRDNGPDVQPNGNAGVYGASGTNSVFKGITQESSGWNWGSLVTETTDPIIVANGELRLGVKNIGTMNVKWFGVDWIKLTYQGTDITADDATALINTIPEGKMSDAAQQSLADAKEALENNPSIGTYSALAVAIDEAKASIATYTNANDKLAAMKKLVDATNVYTEEAYNEYYGTWLAKYDAGTLTEQEANALQDPYVGTGWHADPLTVDNFLLSAWDTNPDYQNAPYYINTWSTEGNNDGTNFRVPFFEYFVNDGNSLGQKTLTATLEGLEPGKYAVNAWTRVRVKSDGETSANGITLQLNDGEPVNICDGNKVDRFFLKNAYAYGTVGQDGKLTIKFNVAGDNNIHWLSFKDVKYMKAAEDIAEFKEVKPTETVVLQLKDAEVLTTYTEDETNYTIIQDATGGLRVKGYTFNGIVKGSNEIVNGQLFGIYDAENGIAVNDASANEVIISEGAATEYEMTAAEATTAQNVFRLVKLDLATITEEDGAYYAEKDGDKIKIDTRLYPNLKLNSGDIVNSITGVTFLEENKCVLAPLSQDAIVPLLWNAENIDEGEYKGNDDPIDLTTSNVMARMENLAAGDVLKVHVVYQQAARRNMSIQTEVDAEEDVVVTTADGRNIFTLPIPEGEDVTRVVEIPITADIQNEVNKHGMKIAVNGVNAQLVTVLNAQFTKEETANSIWLSKDANCNATLGAAHFDDVRKGDIIKGDGQLAIGEEVIASETTLTEEQAAALQDGTLTVTGATKVTFTLGNDPRNDIFEAKNGETFAQGNQLAGIDGMIMTFGGQEETPDYVFEEVYPEVNKFGAVTNGINQFPVDGEGNAYDPEKKNLPTKGTYYVFEPTKDGVLTATVGVEKGKTIIVTEDGESIFNEKAAADFEGEIGPFDVEATKTYYIFANETNMKLFGFKFIPSDADAQNLVKNIANFKLIPVDNAEGDTLTLKDALVTYIKGDNVFVEDASGATVFFKTAIQYYVGQKLNGYIVGQNHVAESNMPQLLRTDKTSYKTFKVTETVTPEPTVISIAEALKKTSLARFVKFTDVRAKKDNKGFRIITDGKNSIRLEDHFNVFYEMPEVIGVIEGIVGIDKEGTYYIWPTSKEGVSEGVGLTEAEEALLAEAMKLASDREAVAVGLLDDEIVKAEAGYGKGLQAAIDLFKENNANNAKETYAKDKVAMQALIDEAEELLADENNQNNREELAAALEAGKKAQASIRLNVPQFEEEIVKLRQAIADFKEANHIGGNFLATGKYVLKNVASGLYWGAGNNWGTRASLLDYSEYQTLHQQADGTYQMESQVSNGGTAYFFEGDYMDNGNPKALTITPIEIEAEGEATEEPLTAAMFKRYASIDAAEGTATGCAFALNESTGLPYGDGNVYWLNYADLTNYDKLTVTVSAGTPRFCLNRIEDNAQDNDDPATTKFIDIPGHAWGTAAYQTKVDDNTYVLDLKKMREERGLVHLHSIKGAYWQNVTVTSMTLTKAAEAKKKVFYTVADGDKYFGNSTEEGYTKGTYILGKGLAADDENALWEIVPATTEALAAATEDEPMDATFLILNPNFGRNNRNGNAWTMEAGNKNLCGGTNENKCAESWRSAFTLSQEIELPNGVYALTAQAALSDYAHLYDGANYPVVYANEVTATFNNMEGADRESNMDKLSASFAAGNYKVGPLYVEVTDGKMTIGVKGTRTDTWCIWDNFQLMYYGENADIANISGGAEAKELEQLRKKASELENDADIEIAAVKTGLTNALSETANVSGKDAIKAAIATLTAAIDKAEASKTAKNVLPKMKELVDATNVYTQDAYDNYYGTWLAKYEAGTLTKAEAGNLQDPSVTTGWHAQITVDNFLLSAWDTNPDFNNAAYYINSWSTEGDNDGTNFRVPFFEYFGGEGSPLGEKTLTATMTGLAAGDYTVTAWARARVMTADETSAYGITFQANDGEAVNVCDGNQTDRFFLKEVTAKGKVGADGVLNIKFNVAAENNIHWLSFKNVKFEKAGVAEDPELVAPAGWMSMISNGNLASDETANYYAKEAPASDPSLAVVTPGAGKNGSRGILVKAQDKVSQAWDTQFWIKTNETLPAGTKVHVEFDYKADKAAKASTQSHGAPSTYMHWACIGDVNFTEEWQHFATDFEVASEADGMQSIAFNLNEFAKANNYYFDNFGVWVQKPAPVSEWIDIAVNGTLDQENIANECFYVTEQGVGGPYLAEPVKGLGKDGGYAIKVQSADDAATDWSTQFFIRLPYQLPAGTKYRVSFDYKADKAGDFETQAHAEPSDYIHNACIGTGSFSTEWQTYEKTGTISGDMSKSDKPMQTIAFNLAKNKTATEFVFDNIKIEVPSDVLATLTANPSLKPVLDPTLIEVAQDQGKSLDTFERTGFEEGENFNTYTATGDLQVAFKMYDIDVADCDYVVVKFAEPVKAGWCVAFWAQGGTDNVGVAEGATEYKYVFADDQKCAVQNDVLPQICMLTLWGAQKPLVANIRGIYKHQVPTIVDKVDGIANNVIDTDAIYNLRGQKVTGTLKPGLYIKNGKKVVIK